MSHSIRSKSDPRADRGFTLIELLVVIEIIAILAAVLFPVFATAREKARQTACLSNMKQIGLAYTQYEQDYDETVPVGSGIYGWGMGWAGQVYPYVKSTAAFLCPDDSVTTDVISYAANSNFVGYSAVPASVPISISQMTAPASSVMLFEVVGCGTLKSAWTIPTETSSSPAGNGLDRVAANSLNGAMATHTNATSCPTCLKYATGILQNVCLNYIKTPCSQDPSTINATTSYYTSPAGVHTNGSNYLLADNHAKFLQPTQVYAGEDTMINGNSDYAVNGTDPGYALAMTVASAQGKYAATFAYH